MKIGWQKELLKQAEIAYNEGEELRFAVVKREGIRQWRIYRTKIVTHGEDIVK